MGTFWTSLSDLADAADLLQRGSSAEKAEGKRYSFQKRHKMYGSAPVGRRKRERGRRRLSLLAGGERVLRPGKLGRCDDFSAADLSRGRIQDRHCLPKKREFAVDGLLTAGVSGGENGWRRCGLRLYRRGG